jgi:hypothetical protein
MNSAIMNRTKTNFWLDVLSLLVMLGLAFTGGIIHFVLPAGTGHFDLLLGLGRHDFGRIHFYLAVVAAALLAVHLLLHWSWVCCVTSKFFGAEAPSRRTQTMWGLALGCSVGLVMGAGLWWASTRVAHNATTWTQQVRGDRQHDERLDRRGFAARGADVDRLERPTSLSQDKAWQPDSSEQMARGLREKHSEQCPAGASIDGRSTLADVARICGLTVAEVKARLRLPGTTGSGERLGRLKRRYDLAIHDVRRLACRKGS